MLQKPAKLSGESNLIQSESRGQDQANVINSIEMGNRGRSAIAEMGERAESIEIKIRSRNININININ